MRISHLVPVLHCSAVALTWQSNRPTDRIKSWLLTGGYRRTHFGDYAVNRAG